MVDFLANTGSYVYRGTEGLDLNIIGNIPLSREKEIKSLIHRTIGNDNAYQKIGDGDLQISIPIFVSDNDEWDAIVDFFTVGKPFIFVYRGSFSEPLNIVGNLKQQFFMDGVGEMNLIFTTALSKEDLPSGFPAAKLLDTLPNKKNWLDKLKKFGENIFDFTSDVNAKVGGFTNAVTQYSKALENIGNGVGGMSSMVTGPISSVKASVGDVMSGINAAITGLSNAISAIKSVPDDIGSMIDGFLSIGDQLRQIFTKGSKSDQAKQSIDFMGDVADTFIYTATAQQEISPNISIDEEVVLEDGTIAKQFRPELFMNKDANKGISVLLLSSILLSLYRSVEDIARWNSTDLENLRKRTEAIYNYISSQEVSPDLQFEMDIARSSFFKLFIVLQRNAVKIIEVRLNTPRFLFDVVYEVNGNYDNYYETKKLNNVVGGAVDGVVRVISNE
jgi:hypothetical protein